MENKRVYKVYMHTAPNNKRYVGITSTETLVRWGYNGEGYRLQMFYRAIKKYGWKNIKHEILFCNLTKKQAEALEVEIIKYYKSNDKKYGYNIEGGGNSCGKISEETKKKISKSVKAGLTPERLKKLSDAHKGQIGRRGFKHSEQSKKNMSNGRLGMKLSEETKKKLSENHKGKNCGEKNGMYGKESWNKGKKLGNIITIRCREVINLNTLEVFKSIALAMQKYGGDVGNVCRGRQKTAKGYRWMYYEEYLISTKNICNE